MEKLILNNKNYTIDDELLILRLEQAHFITDIEEKQRYEKHHNVGLDYINYHKGLYHKFIEPFLNKGLTLDFGCGTTKIYERILDNIFSYDKYFFNDDTVLHNKFDNIILIEVIEHLKNPHESLSQLVNLLNKGGRLFISTHFYHKDKLENWWYLRDETHVCMYNLESFNKLMDKYQLKLVYTDKEKLIVLEKVI